MDENLKRQLEEVDRHTILHAIHGSHAYGTNIPSSDVDEKGVCLIPDRRLFMGLKVFEQQDSGWGKDKVIYHLPKFLKLAGDMNPNIIEILFTNPRHILKITRAGEQLREKRGLFVTKRARHTFSGYAHAQLLKIKAHKRWLDNPPSQPTQDQFKYHHVIEIGPMGSEEFSERTRLVRLLQATGEKAEVIVPTGDVILREPSWFKVEVEKFDKNGYEAAKKEWEHYQSWKKNRNEARAELEAAHHYDTKHAAHLVRLLRMGHEILTESEVRVHRPDREELLEIRRGAWSYEKLLAYAEEMDQKMKEAEEKSTLPWGPDWKAIEELQMELVEEALEEVGGQRKVEPFVGCPSC